MERTMSSRGNDTKAADEVTRKLKSRLKKERALAVQQEKVRAKRVKKAKKYWNQALEDVEAIMKGLVISEANAETKKSSQKSKPARSLEYQQEDSSDSADNANGSQPPLVTRMMSSTLSRSLNNSVFGNIVRNVGHGTYQNTIQASPSSSHRSLSNHRHRESLPRPPLECLPEDTTNSSDDAEELPEADAVDKELMNSLLEGLVKPDDTDSDGYAGNSTATGLTMPASEGSLHSRLSLSSQSPKQQKRMLSCSSLKSSPSPKSAMYAEHLRMHVVASNNCCTIL